LTDPFRACLSSLRVASGLFGGAVALGVGVVFLRRNNKSMNMSQSAMQARVLAQGVCVAGLVGFGAYASLNRGK
jgi:drug/metabolite transporter (DMT)-like permease